jgi:hypothetical protein
LFILAEANEMENIALFLGMANNLYRTLKLALPKQSVYIPFTT